MYDGCVWYGDNDVSYRLVARCTVVMFVFCEGSPPSAGRGVVSSLAQISTGSLASTVESACHATVEIASQFINRTHCVLTHITTSQPLKPLRGYRLCVQLWFNT